MLISQKQQDANRLNGLRSTGPITPEGKARVRLNAVTYGLRARSSILANEDPEEYKQLWNDLVSDWQPGNRSERFELETIATSQWLLARLAHSETMVYERMGANIHEAHFAMLSNIATRRAKLENSLRAATQAFKQLQKERRSRQPQPAQPAATPVHPPEEPVVPPPAHLMPEGSAVQPGFQAPAAPAAHDSR